MDEPEWVEARPEHLPRRTFTPAVVALGLVLLFWGLIASMILTGAGLCLIGVGVAGWIEELNHEQRQSGTSGDAGDS